MWLPFYLLAFFLLERIPGRVYWPTQFPLDSLIPFCEWFVIPYCLWYPLLVGVGVWLWMKNPAAFRRYMRFLAVTFLLSELTWCLLPSVQELRPAALPRDNPLTALIAGLYQIDTNTNVFPSVHVVGAVGAALAVQDGAGKNRALQGGAWLLAALICLSTVFIKQHSLADVTSGLVLSLLAGAPIYRSAPSPSRRRTAGQQN